MDRPTADAPEGEASAELWERTSAKGSRYFCGLLGGCHLLLLFDEGEREHPTRPGETVVCGTCFCRRERPSEARGRTCR